LSENREAFLSWLGGYIDHGACLKAYRRNHLIRGRQYLSLDIHIVVTGTRQIVEYIKSQYFRWNAKIVPRTGTEDTWRFIIRDRTEALVFCGELLPHCMFRKTDLARMIDTIKKEAGRRGYV